MLTTTPYPIVEDLLWKGGLWRGRVFGRLGWDGNGYGDADGDDGF